MRILATCFICLLMSACQVGREPDGTLDRESYLAVYCDLIQESLRGKNAGTDPRTAMQNAGRVLANHGTTRAEFDSTTRWYNADVNRWKLFFDDAAKELESRELSNPRMPR